MRTLLLIAALALAACDASLVSPSEPDVETVAVDASDVAEARERWAASGGDDYAMTLRRSCFCDQEAAGPFDVRVENGEVQSVRRGGRSVELTRALTVLDLFDLLDSALDRDAASVRAAFDTETGYPIRLSVDYDEFIADEEIGYTVWNVRR